MAVRRSEHSHMLGPKCTNMSLASNLMAGSFDMEILREMTHEMIQDMQAFSESSKGSITGISDDFKAQAATDERDKK